MNNTFNIKRFGKVLAKDASDYFPKFKWYYLILVLIPVIIWAWRLLNFNTVSYTVEGRSITIFMLTFLASILIPARLYRNCNDPKKGMEYALMPASSLEKFLSMIIFCIIVTPVLFLLGAVVVDTVLVLLPHSGYKGFIWSYNVLLDNDIMTAMNDITNNENDLILFEALKEKMKLFGPVSSSLTLATWTSVFMFGNMIFKKRKTTKTIGIIIVVFIILIFILAHYLINYEGEPFENGTEVLQFFNNYINIYIVMSSTLTVLMLGGTYFKIKTQKY